MLAERTEDNRPVHSFQTLLADLATIAKNTAVINQNTMRIITTPTSLQQHILDLLQVTLRC